jgi:hypothetical protein
LWESGLHKPPVHTLAFGERKNRWNIQLQHSLELVGATHPATMFGDFFNMPATLSIPVVGFSTAHTR